MTRSLSRELRCALLAEADAEELRTLADACLDDGVRVQVLVTPEVDQGLQVAPRLGDRLRGPGDRPAV